MAQDIDTKFEEKITCAFKNDMSQLPSFHQSTWYSQHWNFWWDPFLQSRKYISLKFTGELCVMKMKNDAKFEP